MTRLKIHMMKKPKTRTKLYIFIASIYLYLRKNIHWYCSGIAFAKTVEQETLKNEVYHHQSFLLRPLRNVEMWMQHNKVVNLRIAIQKLDGLVIKPGETFSYWLLIGNPTASKGYVPGMILSAGSFKSGVGGGLCQLSNLLYWMSLHTPLTITERWRHSYDVFPDIDRKQPFGSGATCSYPNIDLEIKNETKKTFQLKVHLTDTHLVGQWFCNEPLDYRYEIEERNHRINSEWYGIYTRNNELIKVAYDRESGQKVSEELVAKNEAIMMYDPLLESHNNRSK